MSIVITALALAAVQPAMAAPQPPAKAPGMQHSKHPASAAKGEGEGCCGCCKKMEGGKMGGSKEHGEGHAGEHSDHAAHQ